MPSDEEILAAARTSCPAAVPCEHCRVMYRTALAAAEEVRKRRHYTTSAFGPRPVVAHRPQ